MLTPELLRSRLLLELHVTVATATYLLPTHCRRTRCIQATEARRRACRRRCGYCRVTVRECGDSPSSRSVSEEEVCAAGGGGGRRGARGEPTPAPPLLLDELPAPLLLLLLLLSRTAELHTLSVAQVCITTSGLEKYSINYYPREIIRWSVESKL